MILLVSWKKFPGMVSGHTYKGELPVFHLPPTPHLLTNVLKKMPDGF